MKAKKWSLIIVVAIILATTACPSKAQDVYVAGGEGNIAMLWKNGIAQKLTDVGTANSVYISGNDVYVAGSEGNFAMLWKNGVAQSLADGARAFSVYIAGNDVYVAGFGRNKKWNSVAMLWKNGVAQSLTDGKNDAAAFSVCVVGNDVYVAGVKGQIAMLWKNGVAQSLTDGKNEAIAYSVYVMDNDVYIAGHTGKIAMLWKNGVAQSLTDGKHDAEASSVYVSGNDVYVVGTENVKWNNRVAKLWKNGVAQNLSDEKSYGADVSSVYVFGNDVYVAVTERKGAFKSWIVKLWKNGVAQNLTESFDVTANSVFVTNLSGKSEEGKLDICNSTAMSKLQDEQNKNSDEETSKLYAAELEGVYKDTKGKKQITFAGNTFHYSVSAPLITSVFDGTFEPDMKTITVSIKSESLGKVKKNPNGTARLSYILENGILYITDVETAPFVGDASFRSVKGQYQIEK